MIVCILLVGGNEAREKNKDEIKISFGILLKHLIWGSNFFLDLIIFLTAKQVL